MNEQILYIVLMYPRYGNMEIAQRGFQQSLYMHFKFKKCHFQKLCEIFCKII